MGVALCFRAPNFSASSHCVLSSSGGYSSSSSLWPASAPASLCRHPSLALPCLSERTSVIVRGADGPGPISPGIRLARLTWNGQKSKKQTRARASSFNVAVPAAVTADEEDAVPAVTTEALPRPKKVGKGVVRLRLSRFGRKKRPFFRIVATHHSWRRDGKYIELLGHYNPLHAKENLGIVVKADRIKYWLGVGAQPSDTVTGILHKVGILLKSEPS